MGYFRYKTFPLGTILHFNNFCFLSFRTKYCTSQFMETAVERDNVGKKILLMRKQSEASRQLSQEKAWSHKHGWKFTFSTGEKKKEGDIAFSPFSLVLSIDVEIFQLQSLKLFPVKKKEITSFPAVTHTHTHTWQPACTPCTCMCSRLSRGNAIKVRREGGTARGVVGRKRKTTIRRISEFSLCQTPVEGTTRTWRDLLCSL